MPPKVSVVIPVFNRERVVQLALQSALAQTCKDIEIVVVDDASTDGTVAAVERFAHERVRLVRHERNRGGSAARNTGVKASSGTYVAFLDSDDVWLPTKLQRQLDVFERGSESLALVYTGVERIFPDGSVGRHIPRRESSLTRTLLIWNVVGETSLGMVRRSALDAIGGFDESLPSCQDLDLWLRLSERFEVDFVPDVLVQVANGNDADRITTSASSTVRGRELYCRKHRESMIRHGVLYRYLRDTGWCQHRLVRNAQAARGLYLESLRARPLAPLTYALLVGSYMPLSWLDAMARAKRAIARALHFGPETHFAQDRRRTSPLRSGPRNSTAL